MFPLSFINLCSPLPFSFLHKLSNVLYGILDLPIFWCSILLPNSSHLVPFCYQILPILYLTFLVFCYLLTTILFIYFIIHITSLLKIYPSTLLFLDSLLFFLHHVVIPLTSWWLQSFWYIIYISAFNSIYLLILKMLCLLSHLIS